MSLLQWSANQYDIIIGIFHSSAENLPAVTGV
jgi:hypothetical protein